MNFVRSTILEYKHKHKDFPKADTGTDLGEFDMGDLTEFFGLIPPSLFCPSIMNFIKSNNITKFRVHSKGDFFIIEVLNHTQRSFQIVRRIPKRVAMVL